MYNRSDSDFIPYFQATHVFDLKTLTARIGSFGFKNRDVISKTAKLSASNSLPTSNLATEALNESLWTTLGTVSNLNNSWNFISVTDPNYWRYFRLNLTDGSASMSVQEIELYSSSVLSPTVNFV